MRGGEQKGSKDGRTFLPDWVTHWLLGLPLLRHLNGRDSRGCELGEQGKFWQDLPLSQKGALSSSCIYGSKAVISHFGVMKQSLRSPGFGVSVRPFSLPQHLNSPLLIFEELSMSFSSSLTWKSPRPSTWLSIFPKVHPTPGHSSVAVEIGHKLVSLGWAVGGQIPCHHLTIRFYVSKRIRILKLGQRWVEAATLDGTWAPWFLKHSLCPSSSSPRSYIFPHLLLDFLHSCILHMAALSPLKHLRWWTQLGLIGGALRPPLSWFYAEKVSFEYHSWSLSFPSLGKFGKRALSVGDNRGCPSLDITRGHVDLI